MISKPEFAATRHPPAVADLILVRQLNIQNMKILLLAVMSLVIVVAALAQEPSEEKQVREVVQSFYASFNSHAWTHAVDYTTEDWNHINPLGGWTRGREAVLKELEEVHSTFLKGVSDTVEDMVVKFATPDVAAVTVISRMSTFTEPDGVKHEKEAHIRTFIVVKQSGHWLIMQDQNTTVDPRNDPTAASRGSASENVEETIMQVERDWGDALAKRDLVALDRILGDDHSVITKDGSVLTKAQELAKHGESADELFDFEPMKVRVFGDTAVVSGGHREKSQYHGRDTSGHYRWTDLFVKRNGRWQAVASQLTRVEEGKP
jgi:uncharacterized protein (TIGR02246 family)